MPAYAPFWRDYPQVWDQLRINYRIVPGTVKIVIKRPERLDIRKPPKHRYAVLVDQGRPPAEGTIKITLGFDATGNQPYGTGADQWAEWLKLEAELFGRQGANRDAVTVTHPEFAKAGINRVYLEDPGSLEGSGPGVRSITIGWKQFGRVYPASTGSVTTGQLKPKHSINIKDLPTSRTSPADSDEVTQP